MNAPITIGTIETKPERDPYVNLGSVVSRTFLKLSPEDRQVWVTQEYRTNSTSMAEYNGFVLSWSVDGHPLESSMRQWIEEEMPNLEYICNNYERHWTGSRLVGRFTDDEARAIAEDIRYRLDQNLGPANYYEVWGVDDWLEGGLDSITADMTDEQLAEFARECEPDSRTIVIGDILKYITQHRDYLVAEAEE